MTPRKPFYVSLVLIASLAFACRKSDSKEGALREENDGLITENEALQNQLAAAQAQNTESEAKLQALGAAPIAADLQKQIVALREEIAGKENLIAAKEAELEGLKANGGSPDAIRALEKELSDVRAAMEEQKLLVGKLEIAVAEKTEDLALLLKTSLSAYAGIWIMDPKPDLAFDDCNLFVRVDAEAGVVYRAVNCAGGKLQAEWQSAVGFSAQNGSGWSGTTGFNVDTRDGASSCGETASVFATGTRYSFDHSLSTASASSEASFFMSSKFGDETFNFQSGSGIADLGKNKSCGIILTRAGLASQASNKLLQAAAQVCRLTSELNGAGCFVARDSFVGPN